MLCCKMLEWEPSGKHVIAMQRQAAEETSGQQARLWPSHRCSGRPCAGFACDLTIDSGVLGRLPSRIYRLLTRSACWSCCWCTGHASARGDAPSARTSNSKAVPRRRLCTTSRLSTVLRPMLLLSVSRVSCRTTASLHGAHHSFDLLAAVCRAARYACIFGIRLTQFSAPCCCSQSPV